MSEEQHNETDIVMVFYDVDEDTKPEERIMDDHDFEIFKLVFEAVKETRIYYEKNGNPK